MWIEDAEGNLYNLDHASRIFRKGGTVYIAMADEDEPICLQSFSDTRRAMDYMTEIKRKLIFVGLPVVLIPNHS